MTFLFVDNVLFSDAKECTNFFGPGVGTGIGIATVIIAVVVAVVYLKRRRSKNPDKGIVVFLIFNCNLLKVLTKSFALSTILYLDKK